MVNAIICSQLTPQAQQFVKETTQPQPKYFCATCAKLKNGNFCDCFQRRVKTDYNRCFNHSNYNPSSSSYLSPGNLEELIKEEDIKRVA